MTKRKAAPKTPAKKKVAKSRSPKKKPATAKAAKKKKAKKSPKKKPPRTPPTKASKAQEAIATMNDALLKQVNEILPLVAAADQSNVAAHYDIGKKLYKIKTGKVNTYGAKAMELASKALGMSLTDASDHANVAKAWPTKGSFMSLAKRTNERGWSLSWTHFVEALSVSGTQERDDLLAKALDTGESIRALRAKRKKKKASGNTNGIVTAQSNVKLKTAADSAYATVDAYEKNGIEWGKQLWKSVEDASPEDLTEELVESLNRTREASKSAHEAVVKQIDKCIERIEQNRPGDAKVA